MDFPASCWFQHKGNRHGYKVSFRIHLSLRWGFDPGGRAVYTDSGSPLGLCFLRDAIPFSASSRMWETHRKITEYRGCASVFVNKSLRWRHRLTVYATAEGSQRRPLPISKIVQTIVIPLIVKPTINYIPTEGGECKAKTNCALIAQFQTPPAREGCCFLKCQLISTSRRVVSFQSCGFRGCTSCFEKQEFKSGLPCTLNIYVKYNCYTISPYPRTHVSRGFSARKN